MEVLEVENKVDIASIKEDDVFHARYTEKYRNGAGKGWDLRHCFEGLLVAKTINKKDGKPSIVLFDSYWGIGRSDNKNFNLIEVGEIIDITFYCNLSDIEKSGKGKSTPYYYEEKDYVVLTHQHACSENCKEYFIRKGATPSIDKIIASIDKKIEQEEGNIRSANWAIESLKKDKEKVLGGDIKGIWI